MRPIAGTRRVGRGCLRIAMQVGIHASTALTLPRFGSLTTDMSVVLQVHFTRPDEQRVGVAARRALFGLIFVRAFVPMMTFRADSTSDITRAPRLLVSVPVTVIARTTVVPDSEK